MVCYLFTLTNVSWCPWCQVCPIDFSSTSCENSSSMSLCPFLWVSACYIKLWGCGVGSVWVAKYSESLTNLSHPLCVSCMIKDNSPLIKLFLLLFYLWPSCVFFFTYIILNKSKNTGSSCFSGVVHLCISCVWGLPLCYSLWPFQREFFCGAATDPQVQHHRGEQDTS